MDHFKCYELMLRIIRDEDKLFSSISFLRPEKVSFQYCRVSSDRVLTFANPVQTGHKVIIADNREPQERVNGDENVYDESTVFPSFWSHHRSWKLLDRGWWTIFSPRSPGCTFVFHCGHRWSLKSRITNTFCIHRRCARTDVETEQGKIITWWLNENEL